MDVSSLLDEAYADGFRVAKGATLTVANKYDTLRGEIACESGATMLTTARDYRRLADECAGNADQLRELLLLLCKLHEVHGETMVRLGFSLCEASHLATA